MARLFAESFYKSKAWLACRAAYVASVFHLCERCGKPGKILHHIVELSPENIADPDITLGWDNLIYVCKDCHEREHHPGAAPLRDDMMFDRSGQLVRRQAPPIAGF